MAGHRERAPLATVDQEPSRPTLVRAVGDHIRTMIFEQRVRPGQRLVTEAIAADLGVSRAPVREALRQLDGGGLVEVRERRGAAVVGFDRSTSGELVELIEVRRHLEPWAAAEAARHRDTLDIDRIDAALAAGGAAIRAGDLAGAGRAHHELLQAVAQASHNRTLVDTLSPLHNRTAIAFSLVARETVPDGWPTHHAVRDAIAGSDSRSARRLTRAHLDDIAVAVRASESVWMNQG